MSITEVRKMPGMTLGNSHAMERLAMHGVDAAQPKKVAGFKAGDKVLSTPDWEYGVRHGYHRKPGVVLNTDVGPDTHEVEWPDGHVGIHGANELLPFKSKPN